MQKIKVGLDQEKKCYILDGPVQNLVSNRRAWFYLRDSLKADFSNPERIVVPFDFDAREKVLNGIRDLLRRFGFQEEASRETKNVLEEYFQGHTYQWDGTNHHGDLVVWNRTMLHDVKSVSKSITSACVGIAIDYGFIESVHQSIFTRASTPQCH